MSKVEVQPQPGQVWTRKKDGYLARVDNVQAGAVYGWVEYESKTGISRKSMSYWLKEFSPPELRQDAHR